MLGSTELYTCAIHMCATEGDWDDAYQTYCEMREAKVEPDAMVFAVLMDVAARSGRAEKAFELLTEMTHDAGVLPTSEVYRCAAPCVAPGQGGCDTADASDGLAPPPPPALSLRVFGRCEWSLYE